MTDTFYISENGRFCGYVYASDGTMPLEEATINIDAVDCIWITDENGYYETGYHWWPGWWDLTACPPNEYHNDYMCSFQIAEIHQGETCWVSFILEEEKENNPPENLDINGPASCIKGKECNYDLYADDPENNQIYFSVYWGDHSFPEFYKANQNGEATTSHIWDDEGKYTISVYAVDEYAYPSLQITKDITVTKNRPAKYNRLWDLFEKTVFLNKNYFHLLKRE